MTFFFWNFEKNKTLEGVYIGKYSGIGRFKKPVHVFKKEKTAIHIWGSVHLNYLLWTIPFGTKLKITYLGLAEGKMKGRFYKNYEVDVLEAPVIKNKKK